MITQEEANDVVKLMAPHLQPEDDVYLSRRDDGLIIAKVTRDNGQSMEFGASVSDSNSGAKDAYKFYKEHVEAGFSKEQAMELLKCVILRNVNTDAEDPDELEFVADVCSMLDDNILALESMIARGLFDDDKLVDIRDSLIALKAEFIKGDDEDVDNS